MTHLGDGSDKNERFQVTRDTVGRRSPQSNAKLLIETARGWPVHELDTGHEAMVTAPDALAGVLLELAVRPPVGARGVEV